MSKTKTVSSKGGKTNTKKVRAGRVGAQVSFEAVPDVSKPELTEVGGPLYQVERLFKGGVAASLGLLDLPKQKDLDRISDLVVILEQQLRATQAGLARDLNARTRALHDADEALSRVREEYEEVYPMATLASVVPALAHDIATPIGNSNMAVSYLRERLGNFQAAVEAGSLRRSDLKDFLVAVADGLDIIEKSGNVVSELVGSLKKMSIDSASGRRREFELTEVVDEALVALKPTLRKKPITVTRDIEDGLVLDSYPGSLAQILINLVQNAVVHGFDGRDHGTIAICAASSPGNRVTISVVDDGLGMSQKTQAKLFTPFFTTRINQGGSGIGLSFAKRLVEEVLGGKIKVVSAPDQGSRFTIELPKKAPEQQ